MLFRRCMVCEIAHLGYSGATAYNDQSAFFLHQNLLSFTPALMTRIMSPRRHCRITITEMQTCLHALSQLSGAYNTLQCTHFQRLRKKITSYLAAFKSYQHQNTGVGLV